MRMPGKSLAGRLAWAAAILIAAALVVAGAGIGIVLHGFVRGQVDQRLDSQILSIESALAEQNGGIVLTHSVDGPPFDRPSSGWYWQVRGDEPLLASRSLGGGTLTVTASAGRWLDVLTLHPAPAQGVGPHGETLLLRTVSFPVGTRAVTIVVAAPADAVARPMLDALTPLAVSLVVLGVCLVGAIVLQVRLGLRPLARLQDQVAAVRSGRVARLPSDQPHELVPLAEELNTLLDQNSAGLERARRNVANLAHGLKTPLAVLAAALQSGRGAGDSELLVEIGRMERQIRHHLARARAAALGAPARMRTELAPRIADLSAVLAKVHADRKVRFTSDVAADISVACEPQDVDELLGNVMDNAFKWAKTEVRVGAAKADHAISVLVEDDGPGLSDELLADAVRHGRRLDETVPGDGFGLAIAKELAELYNGSVGLSPSQLGGLKVTIHLPAGPGAV